MIPPLFLIKAASAIVGNRLAKAGAWVIIAVLGLWLAYSWAWDRGRDSERARWEAAAAKIEKADAVADTTAMTTAAETKGEIDATNERAADAAARSDDPLAAGLNGLRAEKDRGRN